MILKLNYNDKVQHETRAAFIRSAEPAVWLAQMEQWGINPLHLSCFAVPISKKTIEVAGLLVVFPLGVKPKEMGQALAYGAVTARFFIPIKASLFPQVRPEELEKLRSFDYQIFHPSIGMVGFYESDKIHLEDLLVLSAPSTERWNIAQAAPAPLPPLRRIEIPELLDDDILDNLKDGLNTKPLEDIPGTKKEKSSETWFDKMQRKALEKFLEEDKQGGNYNGGMSGSGGFDGMGGLGALFEKIGETGGGLRAWAEKRLRELERKRQDEINRLMDLFEDNPDEALKYALPLSGNYMGRGDTAPSSVLGRHGTSFSLGGLGGGGRIDSWNLGNRYFELRKKYELEAQRQLRFKNYRKAAYIYAHLLSDFSSAANALVQGKCYREAAVLYQKHLNNKPAAADCLEKGGLLLEAIDLFIDLGKHEKVGDLYRELGQTDKARLFYEKTINSALKNDDYVEVARLQRDKLEEYEIARQSLLTGWQQSRQSEACLNEYFDWMKGAEAGEVQREIEHIYTQYTPKARKNSFLKVLLRVNQWQRDEEILETSRPIAYEIISEQVINNNVGNVHYLRQFLPDDRLIGSDCGRYITQFHAKQKEKTRRRKSNSKVNLFQLDRKVTWQHFVTRLDQLLVIGTAGNRLHLARGNAEGYWNYYSWILDVPNLEDIQFRLVTHLDANVVFVQSSIPVDLSMKKLARSIRFTDDLWVQDTNKLPMNILGLEVEGEDSLVAVTLHQASFKLNFYDANLKLSLAYSSELEINRYLEEGTNVEMRNLVIDNQHYYTIAGEYLCRLTTRQSSEQKIPLNASVQRLCGKAGTLLVYTTKGYLLINVRQRLMVKISGFFAKELSPVDMIFLDDKHFVMAGKYIIRVCEVASVPKVIKTIHTQQKILSIASYRERMTLAVLMEGGEIRVYQVK